MRRVVANCEEKTIDVRSLEFEKNKIYACVYNKTVAVLKRIPLYCDDDRHGMAEMSWNSWHTCTDGDVSACANRIVTGKPLEFYEFDNQREFFEWALKVCK